MDSPTVAARALRASAISPIERVTTTVVLLTPSYVEVIDTSTDETEIPEAAEG